MAVVGAAAAEVGRTPVRASAARPPAVVSPAPDPCGGLPRASAGPPRSRAPGPAPARRRAARPGATSRTAVHWVRGGDGRHPPRTPARRGGSPWPARPPQTRPLPTSGPGTSRPARPHAPRFGGAGVVRSSDACPHPGACDLAV